MALNRSPLRAQTTADVPLARVQAFNRFIDEASELRNVRIFMHGTFDASLNRHRGDSGTKGPRLVICLGHPDARAVTNWTFAFPNLNGKQSSTRSLRYRSDGSPRADGLGPRPAVEAITGDPKEGKAGQSYMPAEQDALAKRAALAVNGMPFFDLFDKDPMESLAAAIDAGGNREFDALAACVQRTRKCLAQAAADPSRAEALGANLYAGFRKVASGGQILAKSGKVLMDGTDPVVRAMASAFPDHMGESLQKLATLPGGPSEQELSMLDAVAVGRAGADPAAEAYQAMGLGALYDALSRANADFEANGCSAEAADLGQYLDGEAMRGLLYLSAYKCVQDHGGTHDLNAKGKADAVGVLPKAENVYYKLCMTRADGEIQRNIEDANLQPKGCAYPKLSARSAGTGSPDRMSNALSYRLFRCEAAGEDPDLASGLPAGRFYIGAHAAGEAGQVLCDIGDRKGVPLQDLMKDDGPGSPLRSMPALSEAAHAGVGAVQIARTMLKDAGGEALDVAVLEMCLYRKMRGPGGPLSRFEQGIAARESAYLEAANGYIGSDGKAVMKDGQLRLFTQMRQAVSGVPDIASGSTGFGNIFRCRFERCVGFSEHTRELFCLAEDAPSKPADAKYAAAFRKMDAERSSVQERYGIPEGSWEEHMLQASPGAAEHARDMAAFASALADASRTADERSALAYAQNDYMVLCDVYGAVSAERLRSVMDDVAQEGSHNWFGLYRPMDAVEATALRDCYGITPTTSGVEPPTVPLVQQGTPEGFAAALFPALQRYPELRDRVYGQLESASLDRSTDPGDMKYGAAMDMIRRLGDTPQYTPDQVAPAVQAAEHRASERMAALGSLLKRTYGEDGDTPDPKDAGRDVTDG